MSPPIDIKMKLYLTQLAKKIGEVETLYYDVVDSLEQQLGEQNIKIPELIFRDLELLRGWNRGSLSSFDVIHTLAKMDLNDTAYNKLIKKLNVFYEATAERGDDIIADLIRNAIVKIQSTALPNYIRYLNMVQTMFIYMGNLDNDRASVIHGLEQGHVFQTREISVDQAVRYVRAKKLYLSNPAVYNNYMVTFGEKPMQSTDEKASEWILCPSKEIADFFAHIFTIKTTRFSAEPVKNWVTKMEQYIYG